MKCSICGKERYAFPKVCGECMEQNGTSWISVKDRLPEHGTNVLVCDVNAHNRYVGVWTLEKDPDDGSDCWEDCGGCWQPFDAVTHRITIPELPEDGTP